MGIGEKGQDMDHAAVEIDRLKANIEIFQELKDEARDNADYECVARFRGKIEDARQQLSQEQGFVIEKNATYHEEQAAIAHDNVEQAKELAEPCRPPHDFLVLQNIADMTDHDAPGIYEPSVIEEVNRLARMVLCRPATLSHKWRHNKPKRLDDPSSVSSRDIGTMILAHAALEKLAGDLNYDNVAQAKEILKDILA